MTHSSLYWHCATYVPNAGGSRRPPHEHQLIAVAGIGVKGEDDDAGLGLDVDIWALASPKPQKLIRATTISAVDYSEFVTFYGKSFGLPVLAANALKTRTQLGSFGNKVVHIDLTDVIRDLVAPSNGLTFDSVLELMQLPARPELDILKAWESDESKPKSRIPQRLIIDCCFVALAQVRLRFMLGEVGEQYVENFTQLVLEAAAAKVSMAKKTFADLLSVETVPEEPEADEPEEEEPEDETTQDVVDALDNFDDFGETDDDDL